MIIAGLWINVAKVGCANIGHNTSCIDIGLHNQYGYTVMDESIGTPRTLPENASFRQISLDVDGREKLIKECNAG